MIPGIGFDPGCRHASSMQFRIYFIKLISLFVESLSKVIIWKILTCPKTPLFML